MYFNNIFTFFTKYSGQQFHVAIQASPEPALPLSPAPEWGSVRLFVCVVGGQQTVGQVTHHLLTQAQPPGAGHMVHQHQRPLSD